MLKASDKERELICQAFDACNIMQEKINFSLNEITEAIIILNESAEKSKCDISQFYNEIRKVLEERENQMKFKIKDQLQKEEVTLKNKENNLFDHMSRIKNFYEEYEKSTNLTEIELLESCLQRQEIIFKATCPVEKLDIIIPFNELNKENELNYLFKLLGNQRNNNGLKEAAQKKNSLNTKNPIQSGNGSANNNNQFAKKKTTLTCHLASSSQNNNTKDVKRYIYIFF